jgi:hypothetical protein
LFNRKKAVIMEFDELQKIWDTQNKKPLYVINEQALHNRIVAKKHQVVHTAVVTEWILIIANAISGGFVLQQNYTGRRSLVLLTCWLHGYWLLHYMCWQTAFAGCGSKSSSIVR